MYSHCASGGWILGHTIDGTQSEYVRIPHADTSLYHLPKHEDEEPYVMLSDIFPTGFECGVINSSVKPGDTLAIVGAGPVGLAALLTSQFYSPARIISIDLDDNRLAVARKFGATETVNASAGNVVERVMALTDGRGPRCPWSKGRFPLGEVMVSQHHLEDEARGHRNHLHAAQDGASAENRTRSLDYAPVQVSGYSPGLWNLR